MTACNFFVSTGGLGVSNSFQESIENNIFINEYKPITNPTIINDTLSILVQSAWLENRWRYAGKEAEIAEIIDDNSCQMKIITNSEGIKGYNTNWQIEKLSISDGSFYQGYLNSIVGSFSTKPETDTLVLKILKGNDFEKGARNILGKLILVKQRNVIHKITGREKP